MRLHARASASILQRPARQLPCSQVHIMARVGFVEFLQTVHSANGQPPLEAEFYALTAAAFATEGVTMCFW